MFFIICWSYFHHSNICFFKKPISQSNFSAIGSVNSDFISSRNLVSSKCLVENIVSIYLSTFVKLDSLIALILLNTSNVAFCKGVITLLSFEYNNFFSSLVKFFLFLSDLIFSKFLSIS